MAAPLREDHPWVRRLDIDQLVAENKAKRESTRRTSPCVLRVPGYIRNLKPGIYDANFLPMGLLCGRNVEDAVYSLKLEVLSCFLELLEIDQDGWKTFCEQVATQDSSTNTPDVEYFYGNDGYASSLTLESKQSILVIDAFFIVGLLIPWAGPGWGRDEGLLFKTCLIDIFKSAGNAAARNFDIFWLYEGQIPLFLVKNAWEKVASVPGLQMRSFSAMLQRKLNAELEFLQLPWLDHEESELDTCDHLLACVHKMLAWMPPDAEDKKKEKRSNPYICRLPFGSQILEFVEKLTTSLSKVLVRPPKKIRTSLPSASQLVESGIRFKGSAAAIGDVRFVKSFFRLSAVLYIPELEVNSFTGKSLLNMTVYEACNEIDGGVHNYLWLMSDLLTTEEDVEVLLDGIDPVIKEILQGNNKSVVDTFTNVSQYMTQPDGGYGDQFDAIRSELINWYSNTWRRRLHQFLGSYSAAPWLLVSLLAASILLVLTVLQTVYTIWGFYKS